jgi:hypothetical protein
MKLRDCNIGTIVQETKESNKGSFYSDSVFIRGKIGHIVGLTKNCTDEIILLVQWSIEENEHNFKNYKQLLNENISPIHPSNVEKV